MKLDKKIGFLILVILILACSSLIKIDSYKIRPVHHDEAVHYFFVKEFQAKTYEYDPEYHGPFNIMLSTVSTKIFGDNINGLRLMYVIFSIGSLFLLLLLTKEFSRSQLIALLVMFGFSPILNYYAGYAFFESFFVFFYALFFVSIIKIFYGKTNFFYILALSAAFMLSINEITYVLLFALTVAFLITNYRKLAMLKAIKPKISQAKGKKIIKNKRLIRTAVLSILLFLAIIVLFYSVCFTQNFFSNILKSITYNLNKSRTTGQNKPFFYYAKVLLLEFTTIAVFLAMIVLYLIKTFQKKKIKKEANSKDVFFFLAAYIIILFVIISLIPYKTPWNTIFMIMPVIFAASLFFKQSIRIKTALLILIAIFLIINIARITFYDYDNYSNNPLAYVQSTRELPIIISYMKNMSVENGLIISSEYWPLPWYLKDYKVNYYSTMPDYKINFQNYDFIIMDKNNFEAIRNSTGIAEIKSFNLRPGIELYLILPLKNG